ncbi:hypothetical protein ABPG72_014935 [Tetrahymena utriculariae]
MSQKDNNLNKSELQLKIDQVTSQYQNDESEKYFYFFKRHKNYLKGPKSQQLRSLTPGVTDYKVASNRIETSQYNWITFLPKNLFIQFSRLANIYFLLIGVCQTVDIISTTNGKPAIYLTLSIITVVSMIKDIAEDRKKHIADRKENESKVKRFNINSKQLEDVYWQNLYIGDIVRVEENEQFPADILILQTTLTNGDCYVETKNLDGETNLKRKVGFAPQILQSIDISNNFEQLLNYQLKYEQPNLQMYNFNGIMANSQSGNQYPINISNICLRGSSLKATNYMYGMIIYTGHQSKILLNSQRSRQMIAFNSFYMCRNNIFYHCTQYFVLNEIRYKFSGIESNLNKMIIWIFILLILICLFCASYYQIWVQNIENQATYLQIDDKQFGGNNAQTFFAYIPLWILLLGHFVPISLMVTLEIVKFGQGLILQQDRNYKNINDDEYVDVNSCNLCEELGRVKYVFSDKTGTLTINQMNFKALCLNQKIYEKQNESIHTENILKSDELDNVLEESTKFKSLVHTKYTYFFENIFLIYIQFKELEGMNCLNLCHTLIIEKKDNTLIYNGTSPDEESILKFCYNQGYYFYEDDINQVMYIQSNQLKETFKFQRIAVLEFDFERKRMSVIVKDMQTQEYKLYCKGADLNIFQTCALNQNNDIENTKNALMYFSLKGLRTLAFGYKLLTKQQVDYYLNRVQQIKLEISDQDVKEQQLNIEMEKDLILLGGTGINDRLQDDVEYTLKNLKTAGIKVWMLTGDKVETAQNIAQQCNLTNSSTDLVMLNFDKFDETAETLIDEYYNKIGKSDYSVLITGYSLYAVDSHFNPLNIIRISQSNTLTNNRTKTLNSRQKLLQILVNSQTVIACKVTPRQKAELVSFVKKLRPLDTILAIGDGANDVSMITTAHIGIGIRGKEGRQAAKISDFSIGEFRLLNRLILYQGQECYRKNTQLIYYNFYKNQVTFLVTFWYNFFSAQSGIYIYDQWVKELYNLLFTSLPIILYCWFDEMYPAHEYCTLFQYLPSKLEKMPLLYKKNLENPQFTTFNFWKQFFKGSFQSIVILFIGMLCLNDVSNKHQHQASHLDMGTLVFTLAVIAPNLRVFQIHKAHYPFTLFFLFASIFIYFIALLIASKIKALDSYGMTQSVLGVGGTYIGIFFMIVTFYVIQRAFDDWSYFTEKMNSNYFEQIIEKEELEKQTVISSDQKIVHQQSSQQNMIEIMCFNQNNNNMDYVNEVTNNL